MQACLISIVLITGIKEASNDLCQAQQSIMCGHALETCSQLLSLEVTAFLRCEAVSRACSP